MRWKKYRTSSKDWLFETNPLLSTLPLVDLVNFERRRRTFPSLADLQVA